MAETSVRTYDPKQIKINFGGAPITGWAEGTFLAIASNGDQFEKSKGADGGIDRVNKNANDYSITITLKQTSLSNDVLSAALLADKLTNAGKLPLIVKDLNGLSTFFAAQAWVAKDPDDENSDGLSTRVWRLDTGPAEKFTGGNLV